MKPAHLALAVLISFATQLETTAAQKGAVELKGGETPSQIEEAYSKAIQALVPDLGKPDGGPLRKFEATVHHSARPNAEPERLACSKAIAAALQGEATLEAKLWLMHLVTFSGKAEVVPALTKILEGGDAKLREMARCALQQNPSPEATEALRNTLMKHLREKKEPAWQAALALALGTRKDIQSLSLMMPLLGDKDLAVQEAALTAIGFIASSEGIIPKSGVWNSMPEKLRNTAAESYMKSAERHVKEGKMDEAARMYQELYKPELPRAIRMAALVGILKATGDKAADRILEILAGEDQDARAIASGVIPDLGSGALKSLATGISKLPGESQIMVLATLAERREKAALPAALEFAKSKDQKMQAAGLSALGQLGDASTIPFLVETMQAGGNAAGMAKDSLRKVTGEGVEQGIIKAMQKQTVPGQRASLIEVIEARGIASAVPVLLQEAVHETPEVRRAAMRALGKLGQGKDVPGLVKGLLKSAPGSEREQAEKAVAEVCARGTEPGKRADAMLGLYNAGTPKDKVVLLPVLGRLGGSKTFDVVKTGLASSETETYQAALDAISNWPESDDTVEKELVGLAQKAEKNTDRAAALRAYVRVISAPSGIPDQARLAKFEKALGLAQSDEDKGLVLERVAEIKRIETLRLVVPYIDKPALMQKACTATVNLARDRGLRGQNKAEFETALKKVVATSKDQALLERANRYLQEKL